MANTQAFVARAECQTPHFLRHTTSLNCRFFLSDLLPLSLVHRRDPLERRDSPELLSPSRLRENLASADVCTSPSDRSRNNRAGPRYSLCGCLDCHCPPSSPPC